MPLFLLDAIRWVVDALASLVGLGGLKITVVAIAVAVGLYMSHAAGWLNLISSWMRMAAVFVVVVGVVVAVGMATGAIAVDMAALENLWGALMEVL